MTTVVRQLVVLICVGFPFAVHGQTSERLTTSDFKGIDLDLDQNPLAPIFTNDARIFSRSTLAGDAENRVGAGISEHSLSGLNADGIFAAEYRVRVDRFAQDPSGTREVTVGFYQGNGVINAADLSNPSVREPNRIYPDFRYDSATQTGVNVNVPIASELREAIIQGSSHIGATIQATFPQGTSSISAASQPIIEITEYYADPFDALPVFSGSTGLVYAGHAGDFVTQGESNIVSGDDATFRTFVRGDNSIDVLINENEVGGDFYSVTLESDDGDLLQIGDQFMARRSPFQPAGMAGFDFSAQARGFNDLIAEFTILDIAYDGGNLERLDVTFSQMAFADVNGGETPFGGSKAFGRLMINATAIPEPGAFLFLSLVGTALSIRRRRHLQRTLSR